MKIESINLADVCGGQYENGSAGQTLHGEIQKDPRLAELLWFLEYLSRTPGRMEAFVASASPLKDEKNSLYRYNNDPFAYTLQFLRDRTGNFSYTGKCPADLKAGLYKLMEQHADAAKATLAETKVSKLIFKELDLALRHKVPVPIIGDSRFGKTKGVSVWCEMRPGQARVVTVPESNRDWDFFAAHADALGIEYNDRTRIQRLKREIEHVLRNSGLFICYDEAHFLTPVNYYANTPPRRINWVRCQVIDKGVGCAFFATPQCLSQSLEKYAAKTKYNLEQWIGRLAPPVVLADYYDRDELMAVAKVHFNNFPEKLLALICSRAMQSEAYLKGMEFAARYASALALDRRHRTPTVQDVDEAIERMMPGKAKSQPMEVPEGGRVEANATPLQSRFRATEKAMQSPAGRREISPGSERNRVADLDAVPG